MVAALFIAASACLAGSIAARRADAGRGWWRAVVVAVGVVAAIPWVLVVAYYFHVVDVAAYFEWRSHAATDLAVGLIGFPVGVVRSLSGGAERRDSLVAAIAGRGAVGSLAALVIIAGLWVVAFAKPLLRPMPASSIHEREVDGVCLQSTFSTCGPCAASTVLRQLGHTVGEAALAREASSTTSGTLNWLLVRAVRARGFAARFTAPARLIDVVAPAIIGVRLGSVGHFVALLSIEGGDVVIGEPLTGRHRMSLDEFNRRYAFDHFAIEVSR